MTDILKFTARTRIWLVKNELTMSDQNFLTEDRTFTEHTHQRVVLAVTSATDGGVVQEFNLAGVSTGYGLMVETDRTIKLGVDNNTNLISIADNGVFFMTGSFTHVYARNDSQTYQATVELIAFDLNTTSSST